MKIDAFSHMVTEAYLEKARELVGPNFGDPRMNNRDPEVMIMDNRIRHLDQHEVDYQFATIPNPPPEEVCPDPAICATLAETINNAMVDVTDKTKGRVRPVGVVCLNNVPHAVKEAERAIKQLGMNGICLHTNAGAIGRGHTQFDDPALWPFFQVMEEMDKPIWIHCTNAAMFDGLKYRTGTTFGWPFNTTVAMTYIIFGGVFDRFPNIKFITHHAGAMVPFFEQRIGLADGRSEVREQLKKPILDYYRMFYVDTAIEGAIGGIAASYSFYGPEHVLFGTDAPYGGNAFAETIASINALPAPPVHKELMLSGNIRRLVGIS